MGVCRDRARTLRINVNIGPYALQAFAATRCRVRRINRDGRCACKPSMTTWPVFQLRVEMRCKPSRCKAPRKNCSLPTSIANWIFSKAICSNCSPVNPNASRHSSNLPVLPRVAHAPNTRQRPAKADFCACKRRSTQGVQAPLHAKPTKATWIEVHLSRT